VTPGGAVQPADLIVRRVEVMGTVVSIRLRQGDVPDDRLFEALAEARSVLHRADAVFSTWKVDSPMNRLRRKEISLDGAPADMEVVLGRCELARHRTGGWFDPWAAPGGVDPTGLTKGWATRRALAPLISAGVPAAIVNAGGDAALWGWRAADQPWRIGIQNPFDRATLIAVAEPGRAKDPDRSESAIATSGSYERGLHAFDPFTGQAVSAVASATVTGPELDLADAMATALLAGGQKALDVLDRSGGYEALVVTCDGRMVRTDGFPAAA
jgi:thiamine biosynthesis lipoprotein